MIDQNQQDGALLVSPTSSFSEINLRKGVSQYRDAFGEESKVIAYSSKHTDKLDSSVIKTVSSFRLLGYLQICFYIIISDYHTVVSQGIGPQNSLWGLCAVMSSKNFVVLADYTSDSEDIRTLFHRIQRRAALFYLSLVGSLILTKTPRSKRLFESIEPRLQGSIFFSPSPLNEEFEHIELDNSIKQILFVGRLVPDKNVGVLIEAFNNIKHNYPEWKLKIVGRGPVNYQNYDSERVVFTGFLSGEDLVDVYKESSIFCFPSLHEGYGNVLPEAAATKNAIVSTDVGIASHLLQDDGVIVPKSDVTSIENGLIRYIELEDERQSDAASLRERSKDYYSEAVLGELSSRLDSIIDA